MSNRNDFVCRSIRISNPKTVSENQTCGSIELDLESKVDDPNGVKQVESEYMHVSSGYGQLSGIQVLI